jgi:hypothetical protein
MGMRRYLAALVAGAAFGSAELAGGAVIYQTVARTGQQAQGLPTGIVYSNSFSMPSINSVGQIVFSAVTNGSLNNVLYAGAPTALQVVARTQDQVPGLPAGVRFSHFHKYDLPIPLSDRSVINDSGQVVFHVIFSGSGVTSANDSAVFSNAAGALQLVAREGTQAPGLPAGVVYSTPELRLNEAGQISLQDGSLSGPGIGLGTVNRTAVFIGTPGAMQLVARDGDPAPGTTDFYGGLGASMGVSTFSDSGSVVFADTVSNPNVLVINRGALFAGGAGTVQLVARQGNPAPGAPAGVNYGSGFPSPTINDAGQIAYRTAWETGVGGVDSTNDGVLYAGQIGSQLPIAREGDAAPGTMPGVTYSSLGFTPILNDTGGVYFDSTLTGPGVNSSNDTAHFAGPWNAPKLIVREGDPAPGTPAGVTFVSRFQGGIDGFGYNGVSFNDLGQVAINMQLAGPGVTAANDAALYLFDPVAGPVKIAREGDQFDIGGGVMRTITDFGVVFIAGLNDDSMNGLSHNGTLVFGLRFTDNTSGIYTATIGVPEPSALWLLALSLTFVLVRQRRVAL